MGDESGCGGKKKYIPPRIYERERFEKMMEKSDIDIGML